MPYIPGEQRRIIDREVDLEYIGYTLATDEDELTYVLAKIVKGYLDRKVTEAGRLRHRHIGEAVWALDSTKADIMRRQYALVEDAAIERNGDL